MNIIDGKAFSERIREKVKSHVDNLKTNHDIVPGLAVAVSYTHLTLPTKA